jgi:hypothetical protein
MATTTYLGTLQYDSGGGTYADIGELSQFTPNVQEVTDVKTSHLASTNATHEYLPGFIEPGMCEFVINFTKASYNTLHGHLTGRSTRSYKVRVNDGSTSTNGSNSTFTGYVKRLGKMEFTTDATNPVRATGTIKVASSVTFTQGS